MTTFPPAETSLLDLGSRTERRSEPRVPVDVPSRLRSLSPLTSVGPSIRARIVEISHSGMKFRSNRQFHPGALVQLMISGAFYMGTVRHCSAAGVEFETGVKLTERIPSSLV